MYDKADNPRRIGEKSVWYLYARVAAEKIKSFFFSADIIIMLRNPVDMLHSYYRMVMNYGEETILHFSERDRSFLYCEIDRELR